jgi:4-amino-4-deoxy-L-arabinose transferase-like glycosyltransferase
VTGRRGLAVALVVAAATRIVVFALAVGDARRFITQDSLEYDALARSFGDAYVHPHEPSRLFDLSLLRPPGYPALISAVYAVTGKSATHVIVVELVLSVLTVALVYFLARRLFDERIAFFAALLLAVDPVSVAMSSNLTTETLFATLWVAAAWLWVRALGERDILAAAAAGALIGLSVLVRPISLYLPLVLAVLTMLLVRARRLALAGVLVVACAVPVGLWIARNAAETGVATVSTIQAHNLLDYRAADAVAIERGTSRAEEASKLEAQVPRRANAAKIARDESRLAWRTLLHHPRGAVQTSAEGLTRVLLGPGRAEMLRLVAGRTDTRTTADRVLIAVEALILFCTLTLAAIGVIVLVRARSWIPLAATLTFAAYDILLAAGAEGNARLRMPAAPFLAVLAAVGLSTIADRSAARRASPSR